MLRDAWRLVLRALPERRGRLAALIALGVAAAIAEGAGLLLLAVIINRLPGSSAGGGMQLEQAILLYIVIVAAAAAVVWARSVQVFGKVSVQVTGRSRHMPSAWAVTGA